MSNRRGWDLGGTAGLQSHAPPTMRPRETPHLAPKLPPTFSPGALWGDALAFPPTTTCTYARRPACPLPHCRTPWSLVSVSLPQCPTGTSEPLCPKPNPLRVPTNPTLLCSGLSWAQPPPPASGPTRADHASPPSPQQPQASPGATALPSPASLSSPLSTHSRSLSSSPGFFSLMCLPPGSPALQVNKTHFWV